MNERTDRLLSWSACGLTLWYVAWTGYALANRVATHAKLFSALGAQLPWPTRVVVAFSQYERLFTRLGPSAILYNPVAGKVYCADGWGNYF